MDPRVRDLYKRFILVGRDYPLGLPYVRDKVKQAFFANQRVTDDFEVKKCVAKGRWMVREMQAVMAMKKYRTLRKRYDPFEAQHHNTMTAEALLDKQKQFTSQPLANSPSSPAELDRNR
mmetsp:Transcript_46082/g.90844  ORF Transcript_46082/g.90844 Transcript_46082/m.90844 type:complete len:119 (+) Transcript_46082:74-430(+)